MLRAVVLCLVAVLVLPASGATLHVARDGGGDFTVIQAAVDAASSGDTIMIGPGRYNEGAIVTTPGWTDFVRVLVRQDQLTFIGAGPDQTIIGPTTPWSLSQGWDVGIEAGTYWGSRHIQISGIGFENMAYGVRGAEAPELTTIRNCLFFMNAKSLMLARGGALVVDNCTFNLMPRNYYLLNANGLQSVRVIDSQFTLAPEHFWPQMAMHLEAVAAVEVSGCDVNGGDIALGLYGVTGASVSSCTFTDQTSADGQAAFGVVVSGGVMSMSGCTLSTQTNAVFGTDFANIEVSHCAIDQTTVASFNFDSISALTVHDCLLAHGPRYAVWQEFPCDTKSAAADMPHLDMTNNDWGTSSADSIAAWIRTCRYVVDYVPFMGQPVPAENTSWGDLKALYR